MPSDKINTHAVLTVYVTIECIPNYINLNIYDDGKLANMSDEPNTIYLVTESTGRDVATIIRKTPEEQLYLGFVAFNGEYNP